MATLDDRLYSGGTDDALIVWDLITGCQIGSIRPHHYFVHAVAVDSDFICTGGTDNRVRVYSRDDSHEVSVFEGTGGSIPTLATDNRHLYS